MMDRVPQDELMKRMARFRLRMDGRAPDWETALVIGKTNMYWIAGTMQDGMLVIPREGEATLWVRRSLERARLESVFPDIRPMASYRDAAAAYHGLPETIYLETESVPVAMFARLTKYFPFRQPKPLEPHLGAVRAVKSPWELALMKRAGEIHRKVMEDRLPYMLRSGMSEAELAVELYAAMVNEGHHGMARFGMFDTDVGTGQLAFGENSLYPAYFNGPGGSVGLGAAAPVLGSRERKLSPGDLVFVDVGCGVDGYHTDKTMTCVFGGKLPAAAVEAHRRCVEVQDRIASMLVPGEIPSAIYKTVMSPMDEAFLNDFMGVGSRRVKFLGHGVGLTIDELPVLAQGFDEPLEEGMAIAIEPKKGVAGVGMVGIENTFLVSPGGGRSITGTHRGLMAVG